MTTIKIAIVGPQAAGKTTFVDAVLFPALLRQDRGFTIHDGGREVARRGGPAPILDVQVFNDPELAAKFLGWKGY